MKTNIELDNTSNLLDNISDNINLNNIIKKRERVDKILVQKYPHFTRQLIQNFIRSGLVAYKGKAISRPSHFIEMDGGEKYLEDLQICRHSTTPMYVSRAGGKLQAAIEHWNICVSGLTAADIGAGTGGFSDLLIERGVELIYTVDVGHGQLSPKILSNPRVVNYEGINIKYAFKLPQKVDILVSDLSFISLRKVVANLFALLHPHGKAILLFKPQFEVGPSNCLNKRGVIKHQHIAQQALNDFIEWFSAQHFPWNVVGHIPSPIKGQEGNQEYLILFQAN